MLQVVEAEEDGNCDVVFEGPDLELLVVATRPIKAGQLLCLAASRFQPTEHDEEEEEEED